jgi:hypothetical protein
VTGEGGGGQQQHAVTGGERGRGGDCWAERGGVWAEGIHSFQLGIIYKHVSISLAG